MRLFKQQGGVISENECWVCIEGGYLYIADTFAQLVRLLASEWRHDKHLVG